MSEFVPGEILVPRKGRKGRERVVVSVGRSVVSFVKIGCSWTDPNPTASYDLHEVKTNYVRTGKFAPETLRRYFEDYDRFRASRR